MDAVKITIRCGSMRTNYLIPVTSAMVTYKMPKIFFKFFIRGLNLRQLTKSNIVSASN